MMGYVKTAGIALAAIFVISHFVPSLAPKLGIVPQPKNTTK